MSFIERKRVEAHLQTCEDCRKHCEDLSRLRKMVYPRPTHLLEYIPFKTLGIALAVVLLILLFGKIRKSLNLPKTPDVKPATVKLPAPPPPVPINVEAAPVDPNKPQVYIPPNLPVPTVVTPPPPPPRVVTPNPASVAPLAPLAPLSGPQTSSGPLPQQTQSGPVVGPSASPTPLDRPPPQ